MPDNIKESLNSRQFFGSSTNYYPRALSNGLGLFDRSFDEKTELKITHSDDGYWKFTAQFNKLTASSFPKHRFNTKQR